MGRSKDSCGTREAWLHGQPCDRFAIYAKAPHPRQGTATALDDVSPQSQRWHGCDELRRRAYDHVPSSICVVRIRSRTETDHPRQRHAPSDIKVGSPTIRESFPDDLAPDYLLFDNDTIFSSEVSTSVDSLGITPKKTAFRSPWQNGIAERWVGSCKRELIDHVIALNESHLRRLLRDYVHYYNTDRVHTSLQDSPEGRKLEERPSPSAKVVGISRVGGLHHRYTWKTAA